MNVNKIREFCLSFPDAAEKLQWDDALCFKVSGKMFAVLGLDKVRFTFKCAPETFTELIEREDIDPSHIWDATTGSYCTGWMLCHGPN